MKKALVFTTIILSLIGCSNNQNKISKDDSTVKGLWQASLHLQEQPQINLPFIFEVNNSADTFTLINGTERITISGLSTKNDSHSIVLKPYDSELRFQLVENSISGVWINYAKGSDYRIPFSAKRFERTINKEATNNQIEKFEIWFGDKNTGYPALAELNLNELQANGTFRTETGDYRYLFGSVVNNKLELSCFDGAHAFLFQANTFGDSLTNGKFYSGNHYTDVWKGIKNPNYELSNPDSITKLINPNKFEFSIPLANGDTLNEKDPRFKNKLVLIQIMGTWCPNCKDETEWLRSIYEQYSNQELEVVAVCFEHEKSADKALKRIDTYKSQMRVPYDMIYGGPSKKALVTEVFPHLDKVVSFPTLIVLKMDEKNQAVLKIHTGFNGPATSGYQAFKNEMSELLKSNL